MKILLPAAAVVVGLSMTFASADGSLPDPREARLPEYRNDASTQQRNGATPYTPGDAIDAGPSATPEPAGELQNDSVATTSTATPLHEAPPVNTCAPLSAMSMAERVTTALTVGLGPAPDATASVVVALFDSAAAFDARRACHSTRLDATQRLWQISELAAGDYAALAFQDLDGDGELDLDDRGLPLEPFAVSGDRRARSPRYDRALVRVDAQSQTIELNDWRLLRRRGNTTP